MYKTAYQQGYESVFIKLGLDPKAPATVPAPEKPKPKKAAPPKAAPVPAPIPAPAPKPVSTLAPAVAPKPAGKPLPSYISELMKRFNKQYKPDQDAYYEVNTTGEGGNNTYGIDIDRGKLNIQRGHVPKHKPLNTFTLPEELAEGIVSGKDNPLWAARWKGPLKYTGKGETIGDLNKWIPVYKYKK